MPSQRNFCSRVEFAEVFVKDADGTFTAPLTGHKDKVAIGAGEEVSAAVVLGVGGNLVSQIVPLLRFFDVSGGGVGEVEGVKEGLWFVEVTEGIIAVRCKLGGYSGPGGDAIVGVVTPGVGVNGAHLHFGGAGPCALLVALGMHSGVDVPEPGGGVNVDLRISEGEIKVASAAYELVVRTAVFHEVDGAAVLDDQSVAFCFCALVGPQEVVTGTFLRAVENVGGSGDVAVEGSADAPGQGGCVAGDGLCHAVARRKTESAVNICGGKWGEGGVE